MRTRWYAAGVAALLGSVLAGCADDAAPQRAAPTPAPASPTAARPQPKPDAGACYGLTFEAAVSPTNGAHPRPCGRDHTAETYAVGTIDNLVDGHLLAVDSQRVQDGVAETCPGGLRGLVSGAREDLRLSMLKPVWFTPTVEQSDAGADWYRCDVVVLAGADRLATVSDSLKGVLDRPEGRDRYGMCGTAGPDDPAFKRVLCSEDHIWRAITVVELPDGPYPGEKAVTDSGAGPCEDAGAAVADDPLDYQWGYEGPDRKQWRAGQTFGRCWAPSPQ